MPELPEVETVRIGLSQLIVGKHIQAVTYDWPKSFPNAPVDVERFLVGANILEIKRRAKVLIIELSTKYSLIIHLKMTGQLVYIRKLESPEPSSWGLTRGSSKKSMAKSHATSDWIPDQVGNDDRRLMTDDRRQVTGDKSLEERFGAGHPSDSLVGVLPDKSTRVIFEFSDSSHLYFNDQRKFGWVRLLPTAEIPNIDFFQKVGPEPLEADFTWQQFRGRLLRRKNSNIKAVLLDQTVIAGVGNIYADESLWGAKIHPETRISQLADGDIKQLFTALQAVLKLSIEKGGSSDKNYVNAEGKKGSYISFANVFRREGKPCNRCGTTIIKTRVAGRGTHICPTCQIVK